MMFATEKGLAKHAGQYPLFSVDWKICDQIHDVRKVFPNVNPDGHAAELVAQVLVERAVSA